MAKNELFHTKNQNQNNSFTHYHSIRYLNIEPVRIKKIFIPDKSHANFKATTA